MIKQEAIDCISALPDTAEWDDILYSLYVIQKIERGRDDVRSGKSVTVEEARKQMGVI